MTPMEPIAVDIKGAARLTSLSPRTISRLIKCGRLSFIRIGRRVLIPTAAIHEFVRGKEEGHGSKEQTTGLD